MPTWVCPATKDPCKGVEEKKRPTYTDDQRKKSGGFCKACQTRLVEVKPKAGEQKKDEPKEDTLVRTVSEAHAGAQAANKEHYAEYGKHVLNDLIGYPKVFQDDFLREWKTGEVQLKFYEPSKRLSGKSLDCVQQAVAAAGLSWPDKVPTGEKFGFEMPYVIGKGLKWTIVGDLKNAFKFTLKTMKTAADKFYLVSTQSAQSGVCEGHTILIVTDGSNKAALLDFQNQKSTSRALGSLEHFYVAWSYPRPTSYKVPGWAMEIKLG